MATRRNSSRHLRLIHPDVAPIPLPPEFEAFITYLTCNKRQAPNTVRARQAALRSFAGYCATAGIDPIRAGERDLLGWQASLRLAPGSVANYSEGVGCCFRWLASKAGGRRIAENPAEEGLPRNRVCTEQGDPIKDEDLQLALDAARASRDWRIYTWLLLEAGTGIRPCQTASLTHHRVRYEQSGRALLTVTGKGRDMVVVAGPDIATELHRWTRNGRGPLWYNANDKPVSGPNVGYAINKHLSRLGIEDTSHGLRRWFGEHAHELTGNDVRTVQEMLGHADPRTTMRYIRPDARRRGDVADQLAARLTRRHVS